MRKVKYRDSSPKRKVSTMKILQLIAARSQNAKKFLRPIFFSRQRKLFVFVLLMAFVFSAVFWRQFIYFFYIRFVDLSQYKISVTFWSTDFHISPIHDLKNVLGPMGVKFFDKSFSGSCSLTRTCNSPLRILTRDQAWTPTENTKMAFYEFYRDQAEMNLVDGFLCFHPTAMCELYMPFNRTIIVIASTRYEIARYEKEPWTRWNENLKKIAADPKNVVAANNLYDAEYIRYFTGINVTVLTSFCGYTKAFYQPKRKEFLLAPIHAKNFATKFLKELREKNEKFSQIEIRQIREIYPKYEYQDLASHPAIIHIPYQVSVMSLFEQYRMNIPLFFPSLDLLVRWHFEHLVVLERTWDFTLYGIRPNRSHIDGVLPGVPDPNNEVDIEAIRYWLKFSDFYQWPHITYFDSIEDLYEKLISADLMKISENMKIHNEKLKQNLQEQWKSILDKIKMFSRKFY